jgi:tRNA pseudouridine55 synthase
MKTYDFIAGEVLAFDKPLTWTSFNLVKMVRNRLSRRLGTKKLKVGHAGTLDPLATGVLIICTGRATKQIDTLQAGTKEYVATLRLGCTTPSFDAEQPIDATYPTAHITPALVAEVLPRFKGSIMQVPPTYSACKVEGRRAFDYAREGEEVALKAKELVIDEIELLDLHLPEQGVTSPSAEGVIRSARDGVNIKGDCKRKQSLEAAHAMAVELSAPAEPTQPTDTESMAYMTLRIVCSKGTYIRALARDIGAALGSGAYLLSLRRTRIGAIDLEHCLKVEDWDSWVDSITLAPTETPAEPLKPSESTNV